MPKGPPSLSILTAKKRSQQKILSPETDTILYVTLCGNVEKSSATEWLQHISSMRHVISHLKMEVGFLSLTPFQPGVRQKFNGKISAAHIGRLFLPEDARYDGLKTFVPIRIPLKV
jgi:hypothetical protein